MNFRTLFILNRVVVPVKVALFGVCILLPSNPTTTVIRVLLGLPFVTVCIFGARIGWRLQREGFIPMRCPLCGRTGDAGRGLTRAVGWWFRCDSCGIVRPQGLLGLRFIKQPADDSTDDGYDDKAV